MGHPLPHTLRPFVQDRTFLSPPCEAGLRHRYTNPPNGGFAPQTPLPGREGRAKQAPGRHLPLISLVNLTLWESVRGFCCSSILLKSKTSQTNSITGCAL